MTSESLTKQTTLNLQPMYGIVSNLPSGASINSWSIRPSQSMYTAFEANYVQKWERWRKQSQDKKIVENRESSKK